MTAAQCVTGEYRKFYNNRQVSVLAGSVSVDNFEKYGERRKVVHAIYHKGYDTIHWLNDIALLRLEKPFRRKKNENGEWRLYWACLPFPEDEARLIEVSGWGDTNYADEQSDISKDLNHVLLAVVDSSGCRELVNSTHRLFDGATQFCASKRGKDACRGDSGAPAMAFDQHGKPVVFGLVSYGPTQCAKEGTSGIYTRLGGFRNWILDVLGEYLKKPVPSAKDTYKPIVIPFG